MRRIWRDHKLEPHQVRSFKFSKDPQVAEMVIDVVGLYIGPPKGALVLCVDEKTQVQALASKWWALGADVEFRELHAPEHALIGVENAGPAADWLAQRFAGAPTTGCHPATAAAAPVRLRLRLVRVLRGRLVLELLPSGAELTGVRVSVVQGQRTIGRSRRLTVSQVRQVALRVRRGARPRARVRITATGRAGAKTIQTRLTLRLPSRAAPR